MADIKEKFGTSAQAITITLDSLATTTTNVGRGSTVIDNSTNLYTDALVQVTVVSNATSSSATGTVEVYAYGTVDGGTSYSDGATGTDGAITLTVPPNMVRLGTINVVATATTYKSKLMSVAASFGGILPEKWGIVVLNKSGYALGTGCSAQYQGILMQAV